MSETEETPVSVGDRVGFRDIYRAVGESEARIIQRIDTLVGPLSVQMADHEQRIRSIETHGSPDMQILSAKVEADSGRLTAVETAITFFSNREVGIRSTLTTLEKAIALVVGVAGTVLLAVNVYLNLAGTP